MEEKKHAPGPLHKHKRSQHRGSAILRLKSGDIMLLWTRFLAFFLQNWVFSCKKCKRHSQKAKKMVMELFLIFSEFLKMFVFKTHLCKAAEFGENSGEFGDFGGPFRGDFGEIRGFRGGGASDFGENSGNFGDFGGFLKNWDNYQKNENNYKGRFLHQNSIF